MRRVLADILVMAFLVTSLEAAHGPKHPDSDGPQTKTKSVRHTKIRKPYQVGTASWYGRSFHGKPTASGEPYDMFQFTAAHRALPLGTLVKVTNLSNGESVIVRINDRGPTPHSRIIDLSYGAAKMIGMRGAGIERVRLDLVSTEGENVAVLAGSMP